VLRRVLAIVGRRPADPAPSRPASPPPLLLSEVLRAWPGPVAPIPHPLSQRPPKPLTTHELANRQCGQCGQTAVSGTHHWDDRGPFQLLSVHTLTCPEGHTWTNSTDGS
jgi:hypothetical protein